MRSPFRHHLPTAVLGASLLLTACNAGDHAAPAPGPERIDSLGVAIVSNPGPDRPLAWQAQEALRLGPADEGAEAFWRIASDGSHLGADADGDLYVLDSGSREVRVFDRQGGHLRTMGAEGEGPGEFMLPTRLLVSADGAAAVADSRKRALVRFAPDGSTMAPITLRDRSFGSFDFLGGRSGGLIFAPADPYATIEAAREGGPRNRRLVHLPLALWDASPSDAGPDEVLANWTDTPPRGVRIEACASDVSISRPLAPSRVAQAGRTGVAWALEPEYVVTLLAPDGSRSSIRRDLPPVTATPELAARDFPTRSIELADHDVCEVTGERAVEAMGFEPVVPWITDLRMAPDGHLFVQRRDPAELPTRRIDVFDPDGTYLGTLPQDFPFPARFHAPDGFLQVERDSLGVPSVVVYRIER